MESVMDPVMMSSFRSSALLSGSNAQITPISNQNSLNTQEQSQISFISTAKPCPSYALHVNKSSTGQNLNSVNPSLSPLKLIKLDDSVSNSGESIVHVDLMLTPHTVASKYSSSFRPVQGMTTSVSTAPVNVPSQYSISKLADHNIWAINRSSGTSSSKYFPLISDKSQLSNFKFVSSPSKLHPSNQQQSVHSVLPSQAVPAQVLAIDSHSLQSFAPGTVLVVEQVMKPRVTDDSSARPSTRVLLPSLPGYDLQMVAPESLAVVDPSQTVFKCDDCDYTSVKKQYLKQHVDLVHTADRPHKCPYCDYAGKRSHSLKEHMVVHSNERPFECPQCNATFRKKGHLTNHIKMHGTQSLNPPYCDICKVKAFDFPTLYSHLRYDHLKENIYLCDDCDFATTAKTNYVLHLHTHGREEIFQCTCCEFVAADNGSVHKHMLSEHSAANQKHGMTIPQSPFSIVMKCTECGFTARDKTKLKEHMWDHLDDDSNNLEHVASTTVIDSMILESNCHTNLTTDNNDKLNETDDLKSLEKETELPNYARAMTTIDSSNKEASEMHVISPSEQEKSADFQAIKGKFTCAVCGYCCTQQRTLKAHIWKHSGNKDVSYPMFQNGPLSIYDDNIVVDNSGNMMSHFRQCAENTSSSCTDIASSSSIDSHSYTKPPGYLVSLLKVTPEKTVKTIRTSELTTTSVFEKNGTKISTSPVSSEPVVKNKYEKEHPNSLNNKNPVNMQSSQSIDRSANPPKNENGHNFTLQVPVLRPNQSCPSSQEAGLSLYEETVAECPETKTETVTNLQPMPELHPKSTESSQPAPVGEIEKKTISVILTHLSREIEHGQIQLPFSPTFIKIEKDTTTGEIILKLSSDSGDKKNTDTHCMDKVESGITCRAPKTTLNQIGKNLNVAVETLAPSPHSKYTGMKSQGSSPVPSSLVSEGGNGDIEDTYLASDSGISSLTCGLTLQGQSTSNNTSHIETRLSLENGKLTESALTLLSLLKRGPNHNPACPMEANLKYMPNASSTVLTSARAAENVDSVTESAIDNSPKDSDSSSKSSKAGICSSLLAVIEQLRGHTKSESEDDKMLSHSQLDPAPSTQIAKSLVNETNIISSAGVTLGLKRKSRKCSVEDDNNLMEKMDNVERLEDIEVKYRCKICHYTNFSPVPMKQHMRQHKTKKPFECSLCEFEATSSEDLQEHMIQHCKVRLYQCKMCSSAFNYKSQLRAHMRAHLVQELHVCNACDFETVNIKLFHAHLHNHHDSESGGSSPKSLDEPPAKIPKITDGALEEMKNIGANETIITAVLASSATAPRPCQNEATVASSIDTHKMSTSKKSVFCDRCNFSCSSDARLKLHLRMHILEVAEEQTSLACEFCSFTALSLRGFKSHMKWHLYIQQSNSAEEDVDECERDKTPLTCELCEFSAGSMRSLKSHMKRHVNDQRYVHQPLEQYKCNLCGYVCHHLPSLKSHMWRHASDQNYSYQFTNEVINAAIDYDARLAAAAEHDKLLAFSEYSEGIIKLRSKATRWTLAEKIKQRKSECMVTFRCCQCGFETIDKRDLNSHMSKHQDVIKQTLKVTHKVDY